ncbi:serine/threonine-protein kinase [Nocardia goodfellowii]|uniref:Serine/threonine protein kinase n=1 Tax=Nocardia goodfellowii TaxID=882446 RepID=A0ABS4QP60_9NOCA|nr:serine/threonine-protein kinase [Nocardia goodfellowii]MBP2192804.1 serine/threonine protein kinase [Nocardia goodfellowii]
MQPLGVNDPRRIGDYRILGVLGAGGMGKVYLGRNAGGRTVAVKVIRPDLVGNGEFRTRFEREVTAAKRVGGRFTAPVLDADVNANPPWLATGYVAGLPLDDAIQRFGTFTEDTLLVLARGLAEALVAVHSAGVVHRDLKPSNVLLAVDGPKVIDFGIARAVEDTALTTTGKVIGSPGFMCPEQVTGEAVVPASDVFALGGVLVYAASGQGPFGSGDTVQMLWRVVYEEPRLEAVPERLRALVAACLAKDPAARPTPQQIMDELPQLGVPAGGGWLPGPVLHEVSTRAVQLLDLDSGHSDPIPDHTPPAGAGQWSGQHTPPPGQSWPGTAPAVEHYAPHGYPGRTDPTQLSHQQTGSRNHWQPEPPKPKRRGALIAGLLVAILVAAGAFVVGNQLRDDNSGAAATSTSPTDTANTTTQRAPTSATAATTTAASGESVPEAFVGQWKGTAQDGLVGFDIELTIKEGKVGQEVATSANTGQLLRHRCSRIETLTNATDSQLTFRARLAADTAGGCVDDGKPSTVELQPDGSLSYSTPGVFGGTIAGVLRKS